MNGRGIVAVVGAGTMGRGIAQVAATAGFTVLLYDARPEAVAAALERIGASLQRARERGRLAQAPEEVLGRIRPVADLAGLASAGWVIEAVPEELELKRRLFAELGAQNPRAVLASNTSTLSITALARGVPGPERVLGLHFFNPAPRMPLVEVIPGAETHPEVLGRAVAFVRELGKEPVVAKDRPGFIVNRIARPYYGEALVLAGDGVPFATVDRILRGLGFPMGPFELMDLIGLDVNFAATKSVWEQSFYLSRYRPHPLQAERVAAGWLGQKTGRGFYAYPREPEPEPELPEPHPLAVHLVGGGPLAGILASRLAPTAPEEADLIVDLRVPLGEKAYPEGVPPGRPVLTLAWGHSVSLARPRYPEARGVYGFSLVPPYAAGQPMELFAPEGEEVPPWLAGFARALGFTPVPLPDQPGGVAFRILAMLANEAFSALREGLAGAETLDRAMELGTRYPRGPLAWAELFGLPALVAGLRGLKDELGEERYRPDPLLVRRAAVGE